MVSPVDFLCGDRTISGQIKVLRTTEAARYLGLSQSTLAKMRLRGDGPPYLKSGKRIVVYDVDDLDSYLLGRKRKSTSDLSIPEIDLEGLRKG